METGQKIVLLISLIAILYMLYNKSKQSSTTTPVPTTPKPTQPPVPESLLNGPLQVYSATGQNNNFAMTFNPSDHSVTVPDAIKAEFPIGNMVYTTTSISGIFTQNGASVSLPLSYNDYTKQIVLSINGNPFFILKPPAPTTPKPTYAPIPDSTLDGFFEVYSKDGKMDEGYMLTFSNKNHTISGPSDFPLNNLTFNSTSISGTFTDGSVVTLPISSSSPDNVTIYDVNNNPIHTLKRTVNTPTPSSSSSTPSTSSTSSTPSNTSTLSNTSVTPYVPVIQPTDPPSSVNGQYIQITGSKSCLSLLNIKVYSSPYGGNIINPSSTIITSSSKQALSYDENGKPYNFMEPSSLSSLITEQKRWNNFMTACYEPDQNDKTRSSIIASKNDMKPWIMINLGSSVPIYKILINNNSMYPNLSLGTVVSILDSNKSVIYTGKPFTDQKGNKENMIEMNQEFFINPYKKINITDYYGSYLFYPSISPNWIGDIITPMFTGVWSSSNNDVLTIYGNRQISLNIKNGPVQTSTYTLTYPTSAITQLGATPAPTSNVNTPIPKIGSSEYNSTPSPNNLYLSASGLNDSVSLNGVTYYSNRFWEYSWLSNNTLLNFTRNMEVTKTVNGVVTKGTYNLTINKKTITWSDNSKSSISLTILSDEKMLLNVDEITYFPNQILGSWVTIDQKTPVVATFDLNGNCIINSKVYQYGNVFPSLETDIDYTYTITQNSFPVYGVKSNRGMLSLYSILNKNSSATMLESTFIKNNFIGSWSGQVISSGGTVNWKIEPFYITELQKSGKVYPVGSYWIHGPNTKDLGLRAEVKTSGSTTYSLAYDTNNDKIGVFSGGTLIAVLSRQ